MVSTTRNVVLTLVLAAGLVGCAYTPPANAPRLDLEPRWRPLIAVVEDPTRARPGITTQSDGYACVSSLAAWEVENPAGALRDALLDHEHVHARDQNEIFLYSFRYNYSRSFRWEEERRGYHAQIVDVARSGVRMGLVSAEATARLLSSDVYEGMVSYDEALSWVLAEFVSAQAGRP